MKHSGNRSDWRDDISAIQLWRIGTKIRFSVVGWQRLHIIEQTFARILYSLGQQSTSYCAKFQHLHSRTGSLDERPEEINHV
jgi:hypothetical protein